MNDLEHGEIAIEQPAHAFFDATEIVCRKCAEQLAARIRAGE